MSRLCALYGVTRAGYYAWLKRGVSHRTEQDRGLVQKIAPIFKASRETYGSPRVHRELRRSGVRVSRRRVARLMGAVGMRGRISRVYRPTARLKSMYAKHPNRLWRRRARRPDSVWVGDVTYLRVDRHWCYLAVVVDQFSRRILGWRLRRSRGVALTRSAFNAAYQRRRPRRLIFHSDRGVEYAAPAYVDHLKGLGVRQSMTSGGAPSENAHAESFFHSLKADVIHGVEFLTDESLRVRLRWYVTYYNRKRLHSALGYQTPTEFEEKVA